ELVGDDLLPTSFDLLPPVPVNCAVPSGRYRVPMVIGTDLFRPASAGDRVGGVVLEANQTFSAGSLFIQRPQVGALETTTCDTDAECAGDFRCAQGGVPGAQRQCVQSTGFTPIPGSVREDFDNAKGDKQQLVTVLFANTGSLDGLLGPNAQNGFDANGTDDFDANPARATDPMRDIRTAAALFSVNLASSASDANTRTSVWWFGGDNPVAGVVPLTRPMELRDHFTNDLSIAETVLNDPTFPSPSGVANVNQAIKRVVDVDLALDSYTDHEKFLFVVTDKPNELYDPSATDEAVLALLKEHDVHTYVIHLDTGIDETLLRDDEVSWEGGVACQNDDSCGAPTCASANDCAAHEVCRPGVVYGATMNDAPSQTPQSYCLNDFTSGRSGPVDFFSQVGCETGGNYIYVTDPDQLRAPMRLLPLVIDGQWSVEADLSKFDTSTLDDGYYRLSGSFLWIFSNSRIARRLSSSIPDPMAPNNPDLASVENRLVVPVGRR
ncbi:MAG: hypothetical protein AAGI01_05950, partial [Myxococcota bacterium]